MVDTHFKSEQKQFLHLDTEKILLAPLCFLLDTLSLKYNDTNSYFLLIGNLIPVLRTPLSDDRGLTVGDQLLGDLLSVVCRQGGMEVWMFKLK